MNESLLRRVIAVSTIVLASSASSAAQHVWRVDATATGVHDGLSWATAFDSLSETLKLAAETKGSDQVWVRALGAMAYEPGASPAAADPRTATFVVGPNVELYGGFAGTETALSQRNPALFGATILSGDIGVANDASDNAYHVITTWGPARVDGLTVMRGNANGPGNHYRGGGIFCAIVVQSGLGSGSELQLANTTLQSNRASQGGGVFVMLGVVTMSRSRFLRNSANLGGAIYGMTTSLRVDSCQFDENAATHGGAVFVASIGQYVSGAPKVQFHNGLFLGNSAVRGGAAYLSGSANSSGKALFGNCTIAGNVASDLGGGVFAVTGTAIPPVSWIRNSIVWGNAALSGGEELYGPQTVSYSNAPAVGAGNFYADPLFGGASGLEPQLGSPCIDAGDDAALAGDSLDLDGDGITAEPLPLDLGEQVRVLGASVDCGAYEL